ncbi:MAG TPA: tetratricopeptide repeat protein, partial [Candidatus Berkiella sp.]|nr:tetratricopeptide repeat protein [Candidatus Berkiella sp.]
MDGFYIYLLGKAHHLNNEFDEAIKYYKRVCDTQVTHFQIQAHQGLGEMLFVASEQTLSEEEMQQPNVKRDIMVVRVKQLLKAHEHLTIASKLS